MKIEQACGMKLLAPVAAAVALSVGASAQFAGSQDSSVILEGRPFVEVSLEGDIRGGEPARRKIVLSRDDTRELELKFQMRPRAGHDPLAVIPTLEEMDKVVMLVNGVPGGMAVIHLDTRAPEVRGAGGGVRIAGLFDKDGGFDVQLPDELDLDHVFAWGQQILEISDLVKKPMAGSAMRPGQRPDLDEVEGLDLGAAAEESLSNWAFYWTDLQLRRSGKASASIEESADLLAVASAPIGTGRVADKIELRRPRLPSRGHGHAQPGGAVVDDTGTDPVIIDPNDPQGGQRAGDKIRLQRPTQRRDHVLLHR
jgi:hypothetical protein